MYPQRLLPLHGSSATCLSKAFLCLSDSRCPAKKCEQVNECVKPGLNDICANYYVARCDVCKWSLRHHIVAQRAFEPRQIDRTLSDHFSLMHLDNSNKTQAVSDSFQAYWTIDKYSLGQREYQTVQHDVFIWIPPVIPNASCCAWRLLPL